MRIGQGQGGVEKSTSTPMQDWTCWPNISDVKPTLFSPKLDPSPIWDYFVSSMTACTAPRRRCARNFPM